MEALESAPLGRYRLVALLGQGGMADVYLACTKGPGGFQKLLVVKLARFTGDPMFSTMFLDEARLAAQLSHPNVVQTYEVGEEGSRHYIVMEYLDGANLARLRYRAKKTGGVPQRMSLQILAHVLEGLEYAHQARGIDGNPLRVVHRDLTPTNIVVTAHGEVKIVDFGIAKAVDTHSFTQTGRFSGKLHYMPPEQLRTESIDGRADIFSAGVVLAEALMGERYWGKETSQSIATRLGQGELPSLAAVPDLDPELRKICEHALAPERDQRYPDAAAFKTDLLAYLNRTGGQVPRDELAAFVCKTVAEDRVRLQAVIDGQLRRVSNLALSWQPPPLDLPHIDVTPSSGRFEAATEKRADDAELIIERVERGERPAERSDRIERVVRIPERGAERISERHAERIPVDFEGNTPLPVALPFTTFPATPPASAAPTSGAVVVPVPTAESAPAPAPAAPPAPAPTPAAPPAPAPAPIVIEARSRAPMIVTVVAAAAALVAVTVAVTRSPAPAPAAPAGGTAEGAPPSAPPPAPTTARVEIIASPASATLALDGHPLATNPYVGSQPRDAQVHELVITAPGFQTLSRRFTLDQDVMLQLQLAPVTPIAAGALARPGQVRPPQAPAPTPAAPAPVPAVVPRAHGPAIVALPATHAPSAAAMPVPAPTAPPTAADPKRAIDDNVYDSTAGTKRAIDNNVYDSTAQTKPTIDRDSPWKK